MVGVVPTVEPIAHAEDAVDDEPGFAADEFALLLTAVNKFDKTRIVAGHYGDELVLALAGKRIEFVEEQAERNLVLNDVVDLCANGALELLDWIAGRIDLARDEGVAILDAGKKKLKEQIVFGFDVVVEGTFEHADVTGDVFNAGGVKTLCEKNVGGTLQDFFQASAGLGLGTSTGSVASSKRFGG